MRPVEGECVVKVKILRREIQGVEVGFGDELLLGACEGDVGVGRPVGVGHELDFVRGMLGGEGVS